MPETMSENFEMCRDIDMDAAETINEMARMHPDESAAKLIDLVEKELVHLAAEALRIQTDADLFTAVMQKIHPIILTNPTLTVDSALKILVEAMPLIATSNPVPANEN